MIVKAKAVVAGLITALVFGVAHVQAQDGPDAASSSAPSEQEAKPAIKKKSIKSTAKKVKVKPKKPRDSGQNGKITSDGAAVYEAANFDAPVMVYMDRDKVVKMSKKIYKGIGGLGAFYKLRVKKGVYGYIADTDVEAMGKSKKSTEIGHAEETANSEGLENDPLRIQSDLMGDTEDPTELDNSLPFLRLMGLAYYSYSYSEVISNRTQTAATPLYGVKLSGPRGIMGGMPLDINLLFTTSAPSFYSKVASSTSGLMLIADAVVILPLYEKKSFLVHYGVGPIFRYSKWDVKLKKTPGLGAVDSQEATLGAALNLGGAINLKSLFRIGRDLVFRVDARYYYEKEKYMGIGGALQLHY